jgi:hypothetical protein
VNICRKSTLQGAIFCESFLALHDIGYLRSFDEFCFAFITLGFASEFCVIFVGDVFDNKLSHISDPFFFVFQDAELLIISPIKYSIGKPSVLKRDEFSIPIPPGPSHIF